MRAVSADVTRAQPLCTSLFADARVAYGEYVLGGQGSDLTFSPADAAFAVIATQQSAAATAAGSSGAAMTGISISIGGGGGGGSSSSGGGGGSIAGSSGGGGGGAAGASGGGFESSIVARARLGKLTVRHAFLRYLHYCSKGVSMGARRCFVMARTIARCC
jgi:hypothetical protein